MVKTKIQSIRYMRVFMMSKKALTPNPRIRNGSLMIWLSLFGILMFISSSSVFLRQCLKLGFLPLKHGQIFKNGRMSSIWAMCLIGCTSSTCIKHLLICYLVRGSLASRSLFPFTEPSMRGCSTYDELILFSILYLWVNSSQNIFYMIIK